MHRLLLASRTALRCGHVPVLAAPDAVRRTPHGSQSLAALLTAGRAKSCPGSQYGNDDSVPAAAIEKPKVTHYSKLGMDGFTDARFNTAADEFLEKIEGIVDALEHHEVEDIGCSGGVLTLETANNGTYIINKQAPNVQLWLSSPVSGPHHYDMVITETATAGGGQETSEETVAWLSDHDGHSLKERMEKELSGILGTSVKF